MRNIFLKRYLLPILFIPFLSWGDDMFCDDTKVPKGLTPLDPDECKREAWVAKCYLDARKDSEIKSDSDAQFIQYNCRVLSFEKYPKPKKPVNMFGDPVE